MLLKVIGKFENESAYRLILSDISGQKNDAWLIFRNLLTDTEKEWNTN